MHWLKFNVVGLIGFALQSAALFVLTHTAYSISYLAATAVAVELAVLNNFIWHQRWTWSDRPTSSKKETWQRLVKFNVTTGLVSLIGNLVLMSILVGRFRLPISGANVITVVACSLLSFFLADRFAFDPIKQADNLPAACIDTSSMDPNPTSTN
jgi:dolichol-phosphate mannosyltransferase